MNVNTGPNLLTGGPPLAIGLIGVGAIGAAILAGVSNGLGGNSKVVAVADRTERRTDLKRVGAEFRCRYTTDPLRLPELGAELVIEAASQEVARKYVVALLRHHVDVLLMSVGALADSRLMEQVVTAAESSGKRVYLPSGAIGGLDLLQAASTGGIRSVTLVTRKPPTSLSNTTAHDGDSRPQVLFDGCAREAVARFPANVNVAATLSLAGVGLDETHVRIVADPSVDSNLHDISIHGEFGSARFRIANRPDPSNPRTSRLAAMSALALLRRLRQPIQVC